MVESAIHLRVPLKSDMQDLSRLKYCIELWGRADLNMVICMLVVSGAGVMLGNRSLHIFVDLSCCKLSCRRYEDWIQ